MKNNAGKTTDTFKYNHSEDEISLFLYLSLNKLRLLLSLMNISSEFQSIGPTYVMLCCFFVVLEYVT